MWSAQLLVRRSRVRSPRAAWVDVSIVVWPAETEVIVFCYVSVWQHVKLSDDGLGTRPRDSLVVEENVKKPKRQTKTQV